MYKRRELGPRISSLQNSPSFINAQSAFARFQQVANRIYGPLFSTGLAALQLGEAAYWGPNAIIRTAPFLDHLRLTQI